MTLSTDLQSLWHRMHELRDAVLPLRLLVTEDCPAGVAPRPVQALADALEDVCGHLAEATDALAAALAADAEPRGRDHLVRMLGRCHERLVDFGKGWAVDVSSYERLAQLMTVARERGPRWRAWAATVLDGIVGCEALRGDVHLALLTCWQDLAERATPPDLSACSSAATEER
jgi:hypothetical protein